MEDLASSSPDPLGVADENASTTSPLKARRASYSPRKPLTDNTNNAFTPSPLKARRRSTTARKPLTDTADNARTQEFYITTPPRSRTPSPRKSSDQSNGAESPWRIRVTVQAEQMENGEMITSPIRLKERTTTTTIPLKGGDSEDEGAWIGHDDAPVESAKPRGRTRRKSMGHQAYRSGTPKPKAKQPKRLSDLIDSSSSEDTWAPTPTRRASNSQPDPYQPATTPTKQTPVKSRYSPAGRLVSARPFSRRRSRSRRKEITPRKIIAASVDPENEEVEQDVEQATPTKSRRDPGTGPDAPSQPMTDEAEVHEVAQIEEPNDNIDACTPVQNDQSASERSILDVEDEKMWRSMIRQDTVSPDPEEADDILPPDPTDCHEGFDTILESEGFSMVSVDSLRSAPSASNKGSSPVTQEISSTVDDSISSSVESPARPEEYSRSQDLEDPSSNVSMPASEASRLVSTITQELKTPEVELSTPSIPAAPHISIAIPATRTPHQDASETPKLERVARLGAALQAIPSPRDRPSTRSSQSLGSPFQSAPSHRLGDAVAPVSPSASRQPRGQPLQSASHSSSATAAQSSPSTSMQTLNQPPSQGDGELFEGFSAISRRQLHAGLRLGEELARKQRVDSPAQSEMLRSKQPRRSNEFTLMSLDTPPVRRQETPPQAVVPLSSTENDGAKGVNTQLPSPAMSETSHSPAVDRSFKLTEDTDGKVPGSAASLRAPRAAMLPQPARQEGEAREQIKEQTTSSQPIVINSDEESSEQSLDVDRSSRMGLSQIAPTEKTARADNQQPRRGDISQLPRTQRLQSPAEVTDESTADLFWQPIQNQKDAGRKRLARSQASHLEQSSVIPTSDRGLSLSARDREDTGKSDSSRQSLFGRSDARAAPLSTPPASTKAMKSKSRDHEQLDIHEGALDSDRSLDEPSLMSDAIDPGLLNQLSITEEDVFKTSPIKPTAHDPATTTKSWMATFTAPLSGLFSTTSPAPQSTPLPATPRRYPPATASDILASSPHERLPLYHPWTSAHYRALEPLYNASVFYKADLFPFDPQSRTAGLLGTTITAARGWKRDLNEADCAVIDAFIVVLKARGTTKVKSRRALPPGEGEKEKPRMILREDIARHVVGLWSMMVLRGEVNPRDVSRGVGTSGGGGGTWTGVRYGQRAGKDGKDTRLFRGEEDVDWTLNRSAYFERKRREFVGNGLPSWREAGLMPPFELD